MIKQDQANTKTIKLARMIVPMLVTHCIFIFFINRNNKKSSYFISMVTTKRLGLVRKRHKIAKAKRGRTQYVGIGYVCMEYIVMVPLNLTKTVCWFFFEHLFN